MGGSPDQGWIQRVTIEIPGPVDETKWDPFKAEVDAVLERYKESIRAKIREIAYLKVSPEEEGPTPRTITITRKVKPRTQKKPRR